MSYEEELSSYSYEAEPVAVPVEPAFEEQIVVESYAVEPVEPEVVAVEPAVAEEVAEEPVAKSKKSKSPAVDDYADDEVVLLSSLVFEAGSRNSRSVALVQERLVALGHEDAGSDQRGWLSAGTKTALAEFCGCAVEECKVNCADTIGRLFEGTSVNVI
jgi:hypothetical protein